MEAATASADPGIPRDEIESEVLATFADVLGGRTATLVSGGAPTAPEARGMWLTWMRFKGRRMLILRFSLCPDRSSISCDGRLRATYQTATGPQVGVIGVTRSL